MLGCEGPWLLKSTDKKDKSFLTPVENADLRLTEDYLLAHQKWKKKESFLEQRLSPFSDVTLDEKTRAIFQEALDTGKTQLVANPETLFSQLRHHPSRVSTKGEMYETLSQLAKRFQFPVQIVAKIHNVMATNAYSPGCFLTSSYVNHSCKHNAIALWDSKSLSFARLNKMGQRVQVEIDCPKCHFQDPEKNRLHFMLIQPLKKGEPITINYFSMHPRFVKKSMLDKTHCNLTLPLCELIPNKKRRKAELYSRFGFFCQCPCCV